ncbi:glycosyltransferase family 4 protein [Zunongwangia sp. F260]|uniref:Glycosyltransferase family 4 protein n=1 Tax=Autumnicola lenta TaxID=3075593 RepID=A0ABU3CIS5_9FLAO|nr:glycosyltransferase family 4 protein [Zunongwangia sp. F260]MDT0646266.1 glycosyltransferase family 4 protein [Zunongwangia sp. F260]
MKILFLSHKFYPDIGGIEVNSEILATAFSEAGNEVHLATWTEKDGEKNFAFEVIRKPSRRRLIKEHLWADLIYENNPCLRLSWPSLFIPTPGVVALRTWISRMDGTIGLQDRLKFGWLTRAKAVIAVSQAVKTRSWPSATVIGNPYRKDVFKIIPGVNRNKTFVFLGRLVSDKGADIAIKALDELSTEHENSQFSLTIIGDGPERKKLEKLVKESCLEEKVTFCGSLGGQELVEALNAHKYIIVPSKWEEPFGNVVLEGMACGCIPIVSDGGGLPDAVGNAGLLFRRGDVKSLVAQIEKISGSATLEESLRNAAIKHLAAHTPELISGKYLQVLQQASTVTK